MDYKDYYKIIGVERSASADEIRKAYRKLALKYHPDRNPGDKAAEDRFKDLNEAYQVLSDETKRARYNQLGSEYSSWQRRGGQGDFDWGQWVNQQQGGGRNVNVDDIFGGAGGGATFSDFFSSLFGGGPQRTSRQAQGGASGRARPATGYQQEVTITLQEAYEGATRQLQTDKARKQVKIPAGVKTGSKVRVAGAGPEGNDLYLIIAISDDARFTREEDDLRTNTNISVFTLMLGGEVEVETMNGKVKLSIPPGTQAEQVFRLGGRGMPSLNKKDVKGNLFVHLKPQIPKQMTVRQRELIEEASKLKF